MKSCIRQNKREIFLYLWLVVMALLNAFFYDTMIVFALVIFVGAVVQKIDFIFYIMAFCMPLVSIFKISADSISVLPVLFFVFVIKLFINKKIHLYEHNTIAFAFFVVLQVMSVLLYGAGIVSTISLLLNVFCVMCGSAYFMNHSETNRQIKVSSIFFISGTILDILIADIFPNITLTMNAQKIEVLEYNNRYAALNMDPNEFSQYVLISICLGFALLPIIKTRFGKIIDVACILFLAYSGYRSYSKSYIVTLLIIVAIAFIMFLVRIRKRKGLVTALLTAVPIIVVGVICTVAFYKIFVLDVFAARDFYNTDFLSGRDYIWSEYMKALGKRIDVIIWGCGQQNYIFLHNFCALSGGKVPHNAYIDFLIQYGVIGSVAFAICWKNLIKDIIINKRHTYLMLAILAFMISSMSLSINANDCIFILAMLVSMKYNDFQKAKI